MWRMNCGCGEVSNEHFEFNIVDKPINSMVVDFELPYKTDRTDCLIEKIIQDYYKIIDNLECGIQPDLENILEEISLIDIKTIKNFGIAKKVYSNNDGTDEDDYLRTEKQLSEFSKESEKDKVINNLDLDKIDHVLMSRLEYDNINEYLENTLYLVQDWD